MESSSRWMTPMERAMHPSDPLLGERLARGDHAALAELYDRYGAVAYGLARRVTRCDDLAADAVRAAFAVAAREARLGDRMRPSLFAWLTAITHREAVAIVRLERATGAGWPGRVPLEGGSAGGALLGALATRDREVIDRCFFEGYRERELACHLDLPLTTVQSRTRAALDALRARRMSGWTEPASPVSRSPRSRASGSDIPTPSS
jgi:RNA polymerase sigma-70 factor (ECF subfamily)